MTIKKSPYHRRSKRGSGKRKFVKRSTDHTKPRLDPALKPVFRKIGVPEPEPFKADTFQTRALELIQDTDVLVSAPTGSGKTWIASQAIHSYVKAGQSVWYASPLKALSNSIYQEFCDEFGPENCGILTGDRKENTDAPITVGTTEILRNQLYDVMHKGTSINVDLVILDEAHYLSDPDRGVVWEETLIYLPPRVRLLLLSATISNSKEICAWLMDIRGTKINIVRAVKRPVPIETLFLFPDGLMTLLGTKNGLSSRVKQYLGDKNRRRGYRPEKTDFGEIIKCLRKFHLLPAIFFLKSRKDCDQALKTCRSADTPFQKQKDLQIAIMDFVREYPHLRNHRQIGALKSARVASHHGGQLPYWKVLVEKMMNRGYLEAIFSTSTVAAGVNFPARSVVLVQSDRFNGHEFADLTATELHQMIGRAGRRGMDQVGFAIALPGIHQDPGLIHQLKDSPPDPINSQIRINFSMVLNLLLSHSPEKIKVLLERSLAAFQTSRSKRQRVQNKLWTDFKRHLRFLKDTGFVDEENRLTQDGYWATKLRVDQPLLIAEAIRKGAMNNLSPAELAGALAPFVWDRSQEIELRKDDSPDMVKIEKTFNLVLKSIKQISALKTKRGFENPPIYLWVSATLYFWAGGITWDEIFRLVGVAEGDMASLIMRTADHLSQIASLGETHPELAKAAEEAIKLILREPVYI